MRKQFMMMIQKSMMQVLNNPNLTDIDVTSTNHVEENLQQQQHQQCQHPQHPQQQQQQQQQLNYGSGSNPSPAFVSGVYVSVEKPILDSIRVLDDHRVRVEVHSNDYIDLHQDLTIPIGQDHFQTDITNRTISIGQDHFQPDWQTTRVQVGQDAAYSAAPAVFQVNFNFKSIFVLNNLMNIIPVIGRVSRFKSIKTKARF